MLDYIDMNKCNNDPNNLFVCSTRSEHLQVHWLYEKIVADAITRGLAIFDFKEKKYT